MRSCLALVLGATTSICFAQATPTTMTQAGFTGLSLTPSARLLGWGRMEFSYDNQLPGNVRDPSGHNYVLGFGLLPNLEIAGRLAANSPQDANCFVAPGCGTRDLSASAKAGIGLDKAGRFHVAAGITDVGGSVTHFRSAYGVVTYLDGPWEGSAGFAKRGSRGIAGSRSPLDGPFAAAAWQPLPWVRGQLEYTDGKAWAGVRLFAPKEWLPEGWTAYVGANRRLTGTNLTEKSWVSAGLSIPLYKVPSLPGAGSKAWTAPAPNPPLYSAEFRAAPPASAANEPGATAPRTAPAARVEDARLLELAAALRARGLEDLWIGRMDDGSVAVRANNATYNWNALDALGVALAAVADTLGGGPSAYRLILTQRQVPLVAVTGQADCLRRWIQDSTAACPAGELTTPGSAVLDRLHAGADWLVRREAPSSKTVRVSLSPVLQKNVGSELGVFDYSLGANVGLELPLWAGARAEARYDVPIAHSDDFRNGGLFSERRVRSRLERLSFTQTMRLPVERWLNADDATIHRLGLGSVVGQASIGHFGGFYNGVHGAVRWEPRSGRHRLSAEAGVFEHTDFGSVGTPGVKSPRPLLAEYRYNFAPTRTYFEATAGQFMNNDLGFQLGMRQWFSDVAVHVYYKRTRLESSPSRQFVGLEVTFPIGPRKDMNPGGFQVTGTPRFALGVETTVRETGFNPARVGHGVVPPVPSLETTFNSDRSSLAYFEDNVGRVREVARQSAAQGTPAGR